jgi:hypothetical protein
MKLTALLVATLATVITANAGMATARSHYKVKINVHGTFQTAIDDTSNDIFNTNDVIDALIDELGVPSSRASDFDIIASYVGEDDDIMDSATYFLARTRGPVNGRYKVAIPLLVFNTEGGNAVFKRVFTANNSTIKVNITDSFSRLFLNTDLLFVNSEGLADAQVTVKDVEIGGDPFLSLVKNRYSGHHVVETEDFEGVGTIEAKIEGKVTTEAFDDLPLILVVNPI